MKPGSIPPLKAVLGIALLLCLLAGAGYVASILWPRVVVVEQRAVNTESGSINPQPGIQPFDKLVDQVCPAIVALSPLPAQTDGTAKPPTAVSKAKGSGRPASGAAALSSDASPPDHFSGFILSADGLIATARRNLGDATAFEGVLQGGRRFQATIKGSDDLTGIALLSIQADPDSPLKTLPFLRFDTTSAPKIGQWVLSVQSPAGAGCSADLAMIAASSAVNDDRHGNYLVLRPPLDPAAIGAPLLNVQGRVVGIGGLGAAAETEAAGLALPSALARDRIAGIQHGGQPPVAYGLAIGDLTPVTSTAFEAREQTGSYVALVIPGSPAHAAGLEVGDIVVKANGRPVAHASDLTSALQASGAAVLGIMRRGQPLTLALSQASAPTEANEPQAKVRTGRNTESRSAPRRP